ncbi:MAG: cupin domain-containing protein [Nitrospinota bacterium]
MKERYCVNVRDIPNASLDKAEGWRMNIKWLLNRHTVGCESACLFHATFRPGAAHEKHKHTNADEVVFVVSGKGAHGQGEEEWEVGPGDAYFVPRGMVHWGRATDPADPFVVVGAYIGVGSLEESGYAFVERLEP